MSFVKKARILLGFSSIIAMTVCGLAACNKITDTQSSSSTSSSGSSSSSSLRFATGTKGVKIITTNTSLIGSFGVPSAVPTATPIPSPYPGYDGVTTYLPGVSPTRYFDLDGTTQIAQPSWLVDFQLGISATSASSSCATFGGSGALDAQDAYRTSEVNCGATSCNSGTCDGTGVATDPVFVRIILNRSELLIGSAENLLVQIEYQASGLHLNSDGSLSSAEGNLDQLWKIFWTSSLAATTAKPFSIFVPPNYGACLASGAGNTGAAASPCVASATYKGAPVKVRQFLIPLSAYPDMKVIQISRVKSRTTAGAPDNYVPSFCTTNDSPLCLGVVIRSITLMRM